MYQAHFGLTTGLFGDGIAADAAVFRSAKHDQISGHFKLALGSPSACIVLRGPAGVGKTTLTAATLRASSTRLALAWLNGMPTNATELLELVLVELGVNTVRTSRIERLQLWRQFLSEMRATESRLFIVVERTEDLSVEVLHALDQLTAPDAVGNPGANVVLLGHSTIDEHLAAPLLESLRQRIRVRTDLAPFSEGELQDYLRHQVACAGGHYDRVFAPGTVAALYRHTGGVTRLVNTLCETALDLAASQKLTQVTPDLVTRTAVSLLGLAEAAPPTRVAPPAPERGAQPVAAATPIAAVAPIVTASNEPTAPSPVVTAPRSAPAPIALTPTVATAPVPPVPVAAAPIAVAPVAAAPSAPPSIAAPRASTQAAATTNPAAPPPSVAARVPAPAPSPPAAPLPAPKPEPVTLEFDGGATDISDVAMADFPVLTDAVEAPAPPSAPRPVAAPAPAAVRAPAVAKPAAAPPAPPPVAKPAAAAASRVETAYSPQKAPPPPAAPKPAPALKSPLPAVDSDDDDLLRQTQTMRAIAVAKSIDDISSSMAETLFGDAELDLVTAALASAADWSDDDESAAPGAGHAEPASKPPAPAAKSSTPAAKPAPDSDDPFALFGLGDDAPLELMDDSTLPPTDHTRKRAAR